MWRDIVFKSYHYAWWQRLIITGPTAFMSLIFTQRGYRWAGQRFSSGHNVRAFYSFVLQKHRTRVLVHTKRARIVKIHLICLPRGWFLLNSEAWSPRYEKYFDIYRRNYTFERYNSLFVALLLVPCWPASGKLGPTSKCGDRRGWWAGNWRCNSRAVLPPYAFLYQWSILTRNCQNIQKVSTKSQPYGILDEDFSIMMVQTTQWDHLSIKQNESETPEGKFSMEKYSCTNFQTKKFSTN